MANKAKPYSLFLVPSILFVLAALCETTAFLIGHKVVFLLLTFVFVSVAALHFVLFKTLYRQ
jgi:hypothetical protein